MYSIVISGLYFAFFVYACFCNNKLLGVETIFLVHLTYFSLIPIGLYCRPFVGLQYLRYSNGFDPFFQNAVQANILVNYSNLGIKSNFLSNINLMMILLPFSLILYFILTFIGKNNNSYKYRPRLMKYGKSFLL